MGLLLLFGGAARAQPVETSTKSGGPVTLEQLVRDAKRANLQIRAEQTSVGEALALLQLAEAQAYPRFRIRGLVGGPTPEAKTFIRNDISTLTPASREGDFDFGELGATMRLNADAVLPLYTFGKIERAEDAAHHLVDAAGDKTKITVQEVVLNVHRAFWGHQLTRNFVESLEEGEGILEGVLEKVEILLEDDSPQVTENDKARLSHALATVRVRLKEAREGHRLTTHVLKLLTGREQSDPLEVERRDIEDIPEAPPPLADLKEEAYASRPEITALKKLIDAHAAFSDFKLRGLLPDIFLGGALDMAYTSNATDQTNPFIYDRFNYFDVGIGLGVSMDLDIFTKLAEKEEIDAKLNTITAQYNAVRQAVDLDLEKTYLELAGRYDRLSDLKTAHRAGRAWLTASVLAYDIGTGVASELIDAFLARATSEGELYKTYFDVQIGLADLDRAIGRLAKDP